MTTLLLVLWSIVLLSLLIVLAFRPDRTRHSWSELQRQNDKAIIRRERLLGDVLALRRVVVGLLLICLVFIGPSLWGAAIGTMAVVGVWLVAGALVRWRPLHKQAMRLYGAFEPRLLDLAESVPAIGGLFRTEKYVPHDQRLESSEHLMHMVESSGHVLSSEQQEIIRRGLHWHTTEVGSIMTTVRDIVSIKHAELLGPLVLDDLHRSGHYRFPVVRGNIDSIIGVIDITNLLEVSVNRRSATAEKAMSPEVLRIESDEPLPAALAMLQKSQQHMLIVVDKEGNTAGLMTLADIAGSLLGKNRGEMVQ